jgi:hypothetical protein
MVDEQELRQLKEIKKELSEINEKTNDPKRVFLSGMLSGAGWFVGGILAVALLGWVLNILGVIPGFSELSDYVRSLMGELPSRT